MVAHDSWRCNGFGESAGSVAETQWRVRRNRTNTRYAATPNSWLLTCCCARTSPRAFAGPRYGCSALEGPRRGVAGATSSSGPHTTVHHLMIRRHHLRSVLACFHEPAVGKSAVPLKRRAGRWACWVAVAGEPARGCRLACCQDLAPAACCRLNSMGGAEDDVGLKVEPFEYSS
jgi:hypothetical protein